MTKAQYLSIAVSMGFGVKEALLTEVSVLSDMVRTRREMEKRGGAG